MLGSTIVKLIKAEKNILTVSDLDAINETPMIDIKPVMREFLPEGNVIQPEWTKEIFKNYWAEKNSI